MNAFLARRNEIFHLIRDNNGEMLSQALASYDGTLIGAEQELGCDAVDVFRKGKSPHALRALVEANFDLLGRDVQNLCPLRDLFNFHQAAQSRKLEAAQEILYLLSKQFEKRIALLQRFDPKHAKYVENINKQIHQKIGGLLAYFVLGGSILV